jgi:hypothetical protein
MSLAWHTAAMTRAKKLPKLSELTGSKKTTKQGINEAEIVGHLVAYQKKFNRKE